MNINSRISGPGCVVRVFCDFSGLKKVKKRFSRLNLAWAEATDPFSSRERKTCQNHSHNRRCSVDLRLALKPPLE